MPYINNEYGFSIHAPAGWRIDDTSEYVKKIPYAVVAFYGPKIPETGGIVNIIIGVDPNPSSGQALSLNEYFFKNKLNVETMYPSVLSIAEETRIVNGLTCCDWLAEITYLGFKSWMKQVYFLEHGKGYLIQLITPKTRFGDDSAVFEESLQTFTLGLPWKTFLIPLVIIASLTAVALLAMIIIYRRRTAKRFGASLGFRRVTCSNCGFETVVDSENNTCKKCGASLAYKPSGETGTTQDAFLRDALVECATVPPNVPIPTAQQQTSQKESYTLSAIGSGLAVFGLVVLGGFILEGPGLALAIIGWIKKEKRAGIAIAVCVICILLQIILMLGLTLLRIFTEPFRPST